MSIHGKRITPGCRDYRGPFESLRISSYLVKTEIDLSQLDIVIHKTVRVPEETAFRISKTKRKTIQSMWYHDQEAEDTECCKHRAGHPDPSKGPH